ncbi:5-nucleotidase family protein [Prevotella sp. CAG:732]|nr:5-nucleotidase family protein [Prevotella sp. CAG:732]
MTRHRPESELSNLLTDILVWGGRDFHEQPVFAVYNMGGIRSNLAKGKVTVGDVNDMAPFENKICFLTLTGEKVTELFQQIAHRGGEGLSHAVRLVITKDGHLKSATINGEPVAPQKQYRIATLDYLAEGNDQLVAFKSGTDVVAPKAKENNVRYIIMSYFREKMAKGESVESQVEGRVVVD